jgi:SNF2 family DNA or RNA helicase
LDDTIDSKDIAISFIRSPKMQALLDLIEKMAPDEKAVIFSEWTSYLDLIGQELKGEGHKFTRLDGTMKPEERQKAMNEFSTSSPRFMLASLRAAGVGITLVSCLSQTLFAALHHYCHHISLCANPDACQCCVPHEPLVEFG